MKVEIQIEPRILKLLHNAIVHVAAARIERICEEPAEYQKELAKDLFERKNGMKSKRDRGKWRECMSVSRPKLQKRRHQNNARNRQNQLRSKHDPTRRHESYRTR